MTVHRSTIYNANFILVITVTLFFFACTTQGTKTSYKSQELKNQKIEKLGFSQAADEKKLRRIRLNAADIYQSAFEEFFLNQKIRVEKHDLTNFKSITDTDSSEIRAICREYDLSGYVCTQITIDTWLLPNLIGPRMVAEDAYVEMKLFDANAVLLLHVKYNTRSDNKDPVSDPRAEKTIKAGTIGALKQLLKEINENS